MPRSYQELQASLRGEPTTWLVTGAAGFIGSHLVEQLLRLGQEVVGLDNFSTGHRRNLEQAVAAAGAGSFRLVEGDVRDLDSCRRAASGIRHVLHQAALGSVPRSVADPATTHAVNATGTLHMLMAAREAGVESFVYASSSSVYGDHPVLPKREDRTGRPLSPYAASKAADEGYAHAFAVAYGLKAVGLRYFNVFGPRQDPEGQYAAVIPLWFKAFAAGIAPVIFGDGLTSRDFCYVANVVQANLRAALAPAGLVRGEVFNVACGQRTTLLELMGFIRAHVGRTRPGALALEPTLAPHRTGDIQHSLADIGHAVERLGYAPTHLVAEGLAEAAEWYLRNLPPPAAPAAGGA